MSSLRRAHYNATVTELYRLHEDLLILRIRPDGGIPPYVAGQFATIGLGVWEPLMAGCSDRVAKEVPRDTVVKRAYSLSSSLVGPDGLLLRPDEEDFLELYVTLVRADDPRVPSLTGRLFALSKGSRLWTHRTTHGRYSLAGVKIEDAVLFLATGTGEAPHNAMLLALARREHQGPIASVTCARYRRDFGYLASHRRLEALIRRYRYVALTTREPDSTGQHIQDLILTDDLEKAIGFALDPDCTHIFVCGNPGMVGAPEQGAGDRPVYPEGGVLQLLVERGFTPNGNVHYEAFW